jgi:putative sigma-54 modulation protein
MHVDITGRHVDITPTLQRLIDKAIGKIERVLNHRAVSAKVTVTREKYRHITELIVHAKQDHTLKSIGEGSTWPVSVREAAAKIEHQAQKLKSNWTEGRRQDNTPKRRVTPPTEAEAPVPRIVRGRHPIKPMTVEDAALRLESGGDSFVVFRDARTDSVSILHRRKDGNLALIETD